MLGAKCTVNETRAGGHRWQIGNEYKEHMVVLSHFMDEETGSQRENMIWPQHTASAEIPNAELIPNANFNFVLFPLFLLPTYLILLPSNHFLHLPILALKIITLLEKYSCAVAFS